MAEDNKALVQHFYEEINAGRLAVIDELTSEGFIEHDQFPGLEPTREGVRKMFELLRKAFPDFQMTMEDAIAEGDKVFVRAVMRGTHSGEFLGVAPTGKPIAVPMADFLRILDGRVVEHWGVTDTGALLQQIGHLEPPTP